MIAGHNFLFVVCQVGAESALKTEVGRTWPMFRFAFSRPGFVTFKLPSELRLALDFNLQATFARTYGFSLGKVQGTTAQELATRSWQLVGDQSFQQLHVWERDSALPGDHDFEPGETPLAQEMAAALLAAAGEKQHGLLANQTAKPGQLVLDCVMVEPNEWWIGFHQANFVAQRWPGGVPQIDTNQEYVSRASLKILEALEWSRLPIQRGDRCAEIGSAPGGASQVLLERGLVVMGIDPAEMDESVLQHANFTHVKMRAADMRRREFRPIKWLFADSNVAPKYTLDTVEAIVTHRDVRVQGMLLTLKLLDWKLADEIPSYVARVESWGYDRVMTRQLAFNRQEICLAAWRTRRSRASDA